MGLIVIPTVIALLNDIEDQQQQCHTVGQVVNIYIAPYASKNVLKEKRIPKLTQQIHIDQSISVLKRLCITPENALISISEGSWYTTCTITYSAIATVIITPSNIDMC